MGDCQFDVHSQDENWVALQFEVSFVTSCSLIGTLRAKSSFSRQPVTAEQVTNTDNTPDARTKF